MNLFVTGGTWVHGSGDPITEESPVSPPPMVACCPAILQRLRTAPPMASEPSSGLRHVRPLCRHHATRCTLRYGRCRGFAR
jgi:hypothetical protein